MGLPEVQFHCPSVAWSVAPMKWSPVMKLWTKAFSVALSMRTRWPEVAVPKRGSLEALALLFAVFQSVEPKVS